MTEFHFREQLEPGNIERVANDNGFASKRNLEKFIMDFEMLSHIREEIPDCAVKGGIAVPFHIQDRTLHRLSVDVDMVTGRSRGEVESAAYRIRDKLRGKIEVGESHEPAGSPKMNLPLLTYFCQYESSLGQPQGEIKLDIFHDSPQPVGTIEIPPPKEIVGIELDFPVRVYDRGYLIGDKMTTLPFNTVGIGEGRQSSVPKQIYDISTLIRSVQGRFPMRQVVDAFKQTAERQISYHSGDPPPIFEDVLDDLASFPRKLLNADSSSMDQRYRAKFGNFKGEFLNNESWYKQSHHVTDILLLHVLAVCMKRHFTGGMTMLDVDETINGVINEKIRLANLPREEQKGVRKNIIAEHSGDELRRIKNMNDMINVYLYDQVLRLEIPA